MAPINTSWPPLKVSLIEGIPHKQLLKSIETPGSINWEPNETSKCKSFQSLNHICSPLVISTWSSVTVHRLTAVSEANLAALMLLTSNNLFSCLMKIQKFGLTPIVVGNFEWQLSQWLFVLIGSLTYLKQNKKILLYQTQRFGGWNEVWINPRGVT